MTTLTTAVLVIMGVSLLLAFVRVWRGPSLPDRVVALDLTAAVAVGMIAAVSIVYDQPLLIDVALVVALLAFVGTVAFAVFFEKGASPWRRR